MTLLPYFTTYDLPHDTTCSACQQITSKIFRIWIQIRRVRMPNLYPTWEISQSSSSSCCCRTMESNFMSRILWWGSTGHLLPWWTTYTCTSTTNLSRAGFGISPIRIFHLYFLSNLESFIRSEIMTDSLILTSDATTFLITSSLPEWIACVNSRLKIFSFLI